MFASGWVMSWKSRYGSAATESVMSTVAGTHPEVEPSDGIAVPQLHNTPHGETGEGMAPRPAVDTLVASRGRNCGTHVH